MKITNKTIICYGFATIALTVALALFFLYQINLIRISLAKHQANAKSIITKTKSENTPQDIQKLEVSEKRSKEAIQKFTYLILLSFTLAALVLIMIVAIGAKIMFADLSRILEFSKRFAKGDYTITLKPGAKDELGELIRSLNYIRNRMENSITKLKQSHHREKNARKEIEATSHLKSDLIVSIAQELRTPLNSILGLSNLLLKEIENGELSDDIGDKMLNINSSAQIVNELIANLMDFSKLDLQNINLNPADINTIDFIRELLHSCRTTAERKNVRLEHQYFTSAPQSIKTDKDILTHIMQNLIFNAISQAPEGSAVRIACEQDSQEIIFWVKNPESDHSENSTLAEIYNTYVEGDRDAPPAYHKVSFLNMTLANGNATLLGGKLESEIDGEGYSTFKLSFHEDILIPPQEENEALFCHTATNLLRRQKKWSAKKDSLSSPKNEITPARQIKLLAAEDNKSNRSLLELIFRGTEITLECVSDGEACLESLKKEKYDGLLLDLQMPRLNGFEVIKRLRSEAMFEQLPILVMTAYLEAGDKESLFDLGANECVLKPIDVDEMLIKIRNLC